MKLIVNVFLPFFVVCRSASPLLMYLDLVFCVRWCCVFSLYCILVPYWRSQFILFWVIFHREVVFIIGINQQSLVIRSSFVIDATTCTGRYHSLASPMGFISICSLSSHSTEKMVSFVILRTVVLLLPVARSTC